MSNKDIRYVRYVTIYQRRPTSSLLEELREMLEDDEEAGAILDVLEERLKED
jgi:hypothetical protein